MLGLFGDSPRLTQVCDIAVQHFQEKEMNPFDQVINHCQEMYRDLLASEKSHDLALTIIKQFYHADVVDTVLIRENNKE
jgi:hypothetical protein